MAERGYFAKPITIDRPMVLIFERSEKTRFLSEARGFLIPANEYRNLLREAGYLKTPKLDQEIAQARARFRKDKVIKWETLKK